MKNKNVGLINKEDVLKRRIVNLSSRTLINSEPDSLRKGLNVCATLLSPRNEEINDDIDAFTRKLNLKEYHASDDMEDITNEPTQQRPTTLEKLNQKGRKGSYRPSKEPYLTLKILGKTSLKN